jgi:hypothetical protein
MRRVFLSAYFICLCLCANVASAETRHARHHHTRVTAGGGVAPRSVAPAAGPGPSQDGVPGNAPFNNQLRKFSDPLGANGAK